MRSILFALVALVLSAGSVFAEPSDFRENLRALHKANHPWAAAVIGLANRTDAVYGDFGQHKTAAWVMTGERKYLDAAAPQLLKFIAVDPLPDANKVREYFAEVVMLYGWLRPELSVDQRAEFEMRLNRWCEFTCAISTAKYQGGWNYADSDLTTGQYLGLLLHDQLMDTAWTKRPEVVKARDAIRRYCEVAEGGEWIESGAYNLGTLPFLLMGAHAAGIEHFPELEKLIPDLAEQQLANLTPDFKQAYQWSDEENPREMHVHRRVALFGILIGLTGDERLQKALDAVLAGKQYKDVAHLSWRALYFYQPPKIPEPAGYLRVSKGNGHFRYKRDGALIGVHFPRRLGVHHEAGYVCDVQWYLDGVWVLSRPLGYGLPAVSGESGNSSVFAGLSSMWDRGPTDWKETTDGFEISGGTRGGYYDPTYSKPPPGFVEHSRKVVYRHPSTLIVSDSFKGGRPALDRYRAADQAIIKAAPLWQQVWHAPVEPTKTATGYTWKTANGKTATLTIPMNAKASVVDEKAKWGKNTSNFKASELKWSIVLSSDEPSCVLTTTFEVK